MNEINKEQLIADIDKNIELITSFVEAVLINDVEYKDLLLMACMKQLQITFPQMIAYYMTPEMREYKEDIDYWSDQINRISNALETKDQFAIVDIFYFETRQNLIEVKKLLCGQNR